jgi:nitrile hydratase accessory protein
MTTSLLDELPAIPRDAEGPVFREPWEAQAFALVVKLHEQGHFTWPEWAALLAEEIAAAQRRGEVDLGTTYYRHWLRGLERISVAKGLVDPVELAERSAELERPPHDH